MMIEAGSLGILGAPHIGRLAVTSGAAALTLLCGCVDITRIDKISLKPHRVERFEEAASVHVAVLSNTPFERMQAELQPKFPMDEAKAIEEVIPNTQLLVERALDVVERSLRLTTPTLQWPMSARRSELVALTVEDLVFSPERADGHVRVRTSKGDQAGHGQLRYVSAEARAHLERWLLAAGITSGPVFRGLNRQGELRASKAPGTPVKALHANEVARVLKDLARRAGYHEPEIKRISGHSPRIGATHALLEAGFSNGQIQLAAGWKSERMVTLYGRELAVSDGAMAQWFKLRTLQ